jgi:hypothetical protein
MQEVITTLATLKTNAKLQGILYLDMDRGAYRNTFQSATFPRFSIVKEGTPRVGRHQKHTTTYYVDDIECRTLEDVVRMLNTKPHPKRTGMAQHQAQTQT